MQARQRHVSAAAGLPAGGPQPHHWPCRTALRSQRLPTWAHEAHVHVAHIAGHLGDGTGGCTVAPGLAPGLAVPGIHWQSWRQRRPRRGAWGRPADGGAGRWALARAAAATAACGAAVLHLWHVVRPVALLGSIVETAGQAHQNRGAGMGRGGEGGAEQTARGSSSMIPVIPWQGRSPNGALTGGCPGTCMQRGSRCSRSGRSSGTRQRCWRSTDRLQACWHRRWSRRRRCTLFRLLIGRPRCQP